ncbi:MAG TPA: hypothetical protein VHN18_10570 [Micromonosporaceae bacterium]|nr:hypothetical protein [Micromonosporaceae bacterium]
MLRLPVPIGSACDYTVAYHVVFADGTDLAGMFSVASPGSLGARQEAATWSSSPGGFMPRW